MGRVPRAAHGQTGSNFGASLTHVTPYLCVVGEDTMVSDGVALTTASFSSTSFQIGETDDRGAQLPGQRDHLPGRGQVGENVLVGTKTMFPSTGMRHTSACSARRLRDPRSLEQRGRKELSASRSDGA